MRPRGRDKHLPACVYQRHGAYWYVKRGKWTRLGDNLPTALSEYARIIAPPVGGCDELIDLTLERYREKVKAGKIAENTLAQYKVAAKQLKKNLAEFTPSLVRPHHVAGLMDMDRHKPNMANRKLSFLRSAFGYGLTWGMCEINPAYGVGRHEENKRTRLITQEEIDLVREKAAPHIHVMMDMALCTGQRIMDVVKIRLADITAEGIYFKQQKTKAPLLVKMNPSIQDALQRARSLHTNVRGLTLFHQRGGKPYGYKGVYDAFKRACKKAGVEDYLPNDHRAKSLTEAKKQGKNPTKLAGHKRESTTDRYLRDRSPELVDGPSIGQPLDNWTEGSKESKG